MSEVDPNSEFLAARKAAMDEFEVKYAAMLADLGEGELTLDPNRHNEYAASGRESDVSESRYQYDESSGTAGNLCQ